MEKFIGDAVVALFGAPVAGENDPERAVRAALAIRDWIAEEGKLQVRIAREHRRGAGATSTLDPRSGEGMAAGDVVNTAARLQSAAPTNGILVGETTYRATVGHDRVPRARAVEAKGKEEPVPVWEVVQARARFGVDLVPETRTPLVGREREVELLVGTLERARQQRSPELVTLVGVPGIGKSRLVGELFQSIERGGVLTYWRQGRSLPYGEARQLLGAGRDGEGAGGDPRDRQRGGGGGEARSAPSTQLVDEDGEWVLSHLRPLVGQTETRRRARRRRRSRPGAASSRGSRRSTPLVLVFEDIQWADDGLLDFIEHLVDWVRDVPMLILCTGAARAARAPTRVGRREGERGDDCARAAVGRRDGDADLGTERSAAARGGDAAHAARARRR